MTDDNRTVICPDHTFEELKIKIQPCDYEKVMHGHAMPGSICDVCGREFIHNKEQSETWTQINYCLKCHNVHYKNESCKLYIVKEIIE